MKYLTVNADQQLTMTTGQLPAIDPDECLLRVRAIGINRADILQKQGKYPPPAGESDILGIESCGELVELGSQVTDWHIGDRVFAIVPGGGYSEFVKVKASHLLPLPKNMSFEQGAAIAEVFLTAYQSLFTIAKLASKSCVLIHAGASGVGTAAIQLAKQRDCAVVVTVSSDNKGQACLKLGADHFVNYHQQDVVNWSKQHFPKGYDVIVDVVAGNRLADNVQMAAMDGRIVVLAMLGGRFCQQLDVAKLLLKRLTIFASTLRNRSDDYKADLVRDFRQQFLPLFAQGKLKPVIDSCFDWHNGELAHQRMMANQNIGKLILTVAD